MQCTITPEEILDVLYGEADAATRERVQRHAASCAACAEELQALGTVRARLQEWTLPPALQPRKLAFRLPPVWQTLAAAAVLLVSTAVSFALVGAEVRFDDGRMSFRLGRPAAGSSDDVRRELAALEARHRAQIAELRASIPPVPSLNVAPVAAGPAGAAAVRSLDPEVLRQVQALLQESESRQMRSINAQLADLRVRQERQRRYDLAQVGASLAYLDGKTGHDVARTTELIGYVLASQQK